MATVISQTANPAGVSATATVATYTGVSIGTAAPNRTIVVVVGTELAAANPSACTIDGNAMTAGTGGDQGAVQTNLFYLPYPTGTTANIAVTFSAVSPTSTQNHIAVYSVVGGTYSSKGGAQSTDMDSTAPLTTGSITIPTDGGFIAVAAKATDTIRAAWANATEDLDVDAGGFGFTTATRTTALTTTAVTCTGTTNGEDGAMSWIIFGANTAPTVALNSPADAATGVSTTPVLDFTGTDSESNNVRYNVQIYKEVATDDFNRADNSSTGMNLGANWTATVPGSDLGISSNQAYQTANTGYNVAFYSAATLANDQYAQVTLSTVGDSYSGLVIRANATDYVIGRAVRGASQMAMYWYNSGAYTQIGSTYSGDVTNGDVLRLEAIGTTFNLYRNSTLVVTGTNGSAPSSGKAGIAIDLDTDRLDNFACGDIVVDAVSGTDAGFVGTGGTPTFANLTSGSSNANGPWNTASVTPTANKLQLLSVYLRNGSSVNPTISTVTGNGLTWVLAQSINFDTASTSRRTLEIWRSMGASPSTGAITITPTETETGAIWSLEEVSGVDISGTNGSGAIVQSATNKDEAPASGVITATLSAFGSSKNATFGVFANDVGSDTVTAGTGFSKLADVGSTDANISSRFTTEYKSSNDTSVDVTFSAIPGVMGVVALEIKSASPFESGTATTYTVQSALTASTTYYWRVRGIDPTGTNTYGAWATTRSFTTTAGGGTVVQDLIGGGFIPFAR